MKQPSTRLISAVWILLSVVLPVFGALQAQTVIGGTNGNASAVLELRSNDRGLLLPRLTSAERSTIVSPAEGLVIYNTTEGCVEINLGSSASPDWNCLLAITGRVGSVYCEAATQTGTLTAGFAANNVSTDISYTGGNGSFYKGQTVTSTGVTGLTATLAAGTFVSGSGSVTYTITGIPSGSGTASFALSIGGQSCTLSRTVSAPSGSIISLNCGGATNSGSLVSGQSASGVSSIVPYTGGNGGTYSGQTVSSTGVTGLTATLAAGTLSSSSGSLTYTITGTPSGSGTASFTLSLGGQSCTLSRTVSAPAGGISSLNCGGATNNGSLVSGYPVLSTCSVSSVILYTGGNGGNYGTQTVTSTGVTGLTARLESGTLAIGSGSLTYTIRGTPSGSGTASFALSLGGQSCTLSLAVSSVPGEGCGAYVDCGVWKQFMCHNLGANTSADPFTPSWELIGNYYQWGRNPTCFGKDTIDAPNPCSGPVYGAAAPWGNTTANDNAGGIPGWNLTPSADTAWVNDPCPAGWRVPTINQLTSVGRWSPRIWVGTWTGGNTNYTSGLRFGSSLFLPATGSGYSSSGLSNRGNSGAYWSSETRSIYGIVRAETLYFNDINILDSWSNLIIGHSVRCIAE
jgi:hypothetical protein